MRKFEISYINELSFVTEWMSDTQESFDELRLRTKEIANKYLRFLSEVSGDNGIKIKYYDLDSDDFGEDVVKWLVTFEIGDTEGIVEELCNEDSFVKVKHHVIDAVTQAILLEGDFVACANYIENALPHLDITSERDADVIVKHMYIEEYQEKYLSLDVKAD